MLQKRTEETRCYKTAQSSAHAMLILRFPQHCTGSRHRDNVRDYFQKIAQETGFIQVHPPPPLPLTHLHLTSPQPLLVGPGMANRIMFNQGGGGMNPNLGPPGAFNQGPMGMGMGPPQVLYP
jgi:hypothetical protein